MGGEGGDLRNVVRRPHQNIPHCTSMPFRVIPLEGIRLPSLTLLTWKGVSSRVPPIAVDTLPKFFLPSALGKAFL